MVLVKKKVTLSGKITYVFSVHISFPSTYDVLSFPSSFSVCTSATNPSTFHTPPWHGLLVKAVTLRDEIRASRKEFGDKNYIWMQMSPIPV